MGWVLAFIVFYVLLCVCYCGVFLVEKILKKIKKRG